MRCQARRRWKIPSLKTLEVEKKILENVEPDDLRSVLAYAGQRFTETEPLFGDRYGQIVVSLKPVSEGSREVKTIIEGMREEVTGVLGPVDINFLELAGGPPFCQTYQR